MTKVGVILSGSGYLDGSEITEAVLTLLALDRAGATIIPMAPDVESSDVINHITGEEVRGESRDVIVEAARIVRGHVTSLNDISAHDVDALILIGGFGAAKNLCTFAVDGVNATINPQVKRLVAEMAGLGKPIGAMCIAPVVVALALRGRSNATPPILTVGSDADTIAAIESWEAKHQVTTVDQICIDEGNRIVSTAAYMLASGPAEAETGINKLVEHVLSIAGDTNAFYKKNL